MGLDGGPGYIYSGEHRAEAEPKENGPVGTLLGCPREDSRDGDGEVPGFS